MVQGLLTKETQRCIDVLEEFRKLDPEMQAQTILAFLHVMDQPGMPMGQLAERIGYSQASTSGNVAALSDHHRKGRTGAGLLEAREDLDNRRQKLVWLTRKGQVFARQLREVMK